MDTNSLEKIAARLLASGKGILAADESTGTANKRFAALGIPQDEETRRNWRELLVTSPGVETGLSGIILYDETVRQKVSDGTPFPEFLSKLGIIPGIKVDRGTVDLENFPGEKVTEGLDGLAARLAEYFQMGARFTKWRAVIKIGAGIPTQECIDMNACILARYAALSQEAGLVPIVEPEVLIDGNHTLAQSETALTQTLTSVFTALKKYRVHLPGAILKSSMALPGKESGIKATPQEIAEATIRAFKASVPQELSGVVFLSGGQTPLEATENLNEMVKAGSYPKRLTFSYSRALQAPAMEAWTGKSENKAKAQEIFATRVKETALASEGKYAK
ncbi:MAG: class I fructose-bisphosphate aldolase [Candidatus Liptonbacteria bacterium]|nr:class I fructose-bisphosphate aldolase [Candidatus Liptonbacteria bacterium]